MDVPLLIVGGILILLLNKLMESFESIANGVSNSLLLVELDAICDHMISTSLTTSSFQ